MKSKTLLIYLISLLLLIPITAAITHATVEVTCFSKDYTRDKGKPVTITDTFYSAHEGTGTVKVTTNAKVTGAIITLNGEVLWTPKHFKKKITEYVKSGNLVEGQNTLEVYIKNKPDGWLQVEVLQELVEDESHVKPLDTSKIFVDPDGPVFPVNQLILALTDDATTAAAEEIAALIGAVIVGFIPVINTYQIIVPASTPEEIESIITNLNGIGDPRVRGVTRNYLTKTASIPSDLAILKGIDEETTVAYDRIKIFDAWDAGKDKGSSEITIGIIDSGVQSDHQEFREPDVNFGSSDNVTDLIDSDPFGHGTQVAGIIGANNRAAASLSWRSLEMNGIVSGILDETSYTMEIRSSASVLEDMNAIYNLGSKAAVVNISKSSPRCSVKWLNDLEGTCILDVGFEIIFDLMTAAMAYRSNTLFVVSAGNDGINVSDTGLGGIRVPRVIPGAISLSNVLTIAATTVSSDPLLDNREPNSNWGSRIDLAAPGEKIYAPRPGGLYDYFGDTSGAASMVTGVAAILLAIDSELTPQEIKDILCQTGDDITTDEPISGKRLNAYKAVKRALGEEPEYTITDLNTLGGTESWAVAINTPGQVVGSSFITDDFEFHAFLWENNVMTDLGHLGGRDSIARDVNDFRQVVGDSFISDDIPNYGPHAFLWENSVMTDLGTLGGSSPSGNTSSTAYDINNFGQVVGVSISLSGDSHAFLITPEDTNSDSIPDLWFRDYNSDGANDLMADLSTLGGPNSAGNCIINSGQIVGVSDTASGERHAFLWENSVMTDLGTLGGTRSSAFDMSFSGQIVGGSTTTTSASYHAFLITPEDTNSDSIPDLWFRDDNSDGINDLMTDLSTLGGSYGFARAVNASNQVVGNSNISGDTTDHAFLWEKGVITDLNDLIPPNSGWELLIAHDINDAGQIVGEGIINGESHAFLLIPR